ncbi:unnamed protein product [Cuscuta campestris]|uniref:F-box domain-containing protein n=1 Tax=Cuscuta campestris TaxID=132261 RepID=A0A484N0P7_9ASTE|nr:unnamed protein product [Cuscuta campestris]
MSDNVCLSSDLWPEILKRVPAKDVGRCCCVCKSWNTLIKSPSFITAHIGFAQTHLFFRHVTLTPSFKEEHFTHFADEAHHRCDLGYPPVKTWLSHFRVVGSVSGLICLSDDLYANPEKETIVLWNPVVSRYVDLSRPRDVGKKCERVIGFGFDSKKNDYKVVHLSYNVSEKPCFNVTPPKARVYSVRERAWKSISADYVHCCVLDYYWSQCFVNGAIHWLAYEKGKNHGFSNNALLLFDVESERFKKMKFPEALRETCPLLLSVFELRGQLSLMEYEVKGEWRSRCTIWVKKEYTVSTSWSKAVTLKLNDWMGEVLRPIENGRMLIVARDGCLISYDLKKKLTTRIEHGHPEGFYVGAYTESLVLLDDESGASSYPKNTKKSNRKDRSNSDKAGKREWSDQFEALLLMYQDTRTATQMQKLQWVF